MLDGASVPLRDQYENTEVAPTQRIGRHLSCPVFLHKIMWRTKSDPVPSVHEDRNGNRSVQIVYTSRITISQVHLTCIQSNHKCGKCCVINVS